MAITIRIDDNIKSKFAAIAQQEGESQHSLFEKMLEAYIAQQNDAYPLLVDLLEKISEAEQQIEAWYWDKPEPEHTQNLKERLELAYKIISTAPEVENNEASYVMLEGEKTYRFCTSRLSKEQKKIIKNLT